MMKKEKQCQNCDIQLDKNTPTGTEKDGSLSLKYCTHCYQNGQ